MKKQKELAPSALVPVGEDGLDYEMAADQDGAWITVGDLSVFVIRTRTGVRVELYPRFHEACCDALAECELDNDAKGRADEDHAGSE